MLTPTIEAALRDSLAQHHVIDVDVYKIPEFQQIAESIKVNSDGSVDTTTLYTAIQKMQSSKPSLFRKTDYAQMNESEFASAETRMRDELRKPPTAQPTPFKDLDAARLDDRELAALTRCVGGSSNNWDAGLLTAALARQRAEDAAISEGATNA